VINGTGVLIHTNLGRAPLGSSAASALGSIAEHYNNLELDLESGERGGRAAYVDRLLALLCGAEAAMVVNNCAAALVLILRHFTAGSRKDVVISRGELVQIGGGFRIPEILEVSGARLREVGTTNRTSLADYARVLGRGTAMILRVHRSNFFMRGFVDSPAAEELAALARRKRLPFVEDLGSGAVVDTHRWVGIEHEPMPAEVVRRGTDLVCFSGDKLFGGPQAGVIAGRTKFVAALRRDPFFRALRCDKLILAALQGTAESWLALPGAPGALTTTTGLPVLDQLRADIGRLEVRAGMLVKALADLPLEIAPGRGQSQVGGGTLPAAAVESVTLELKPIAVPPAELARRLRREQPPVIVVVAAGRLRIDLRTVFPDQDEALVQAIRRAMDPAYHD
jgi:L-seryl-tRNA(Ser) seleniumtransferase